MLRGYLGQQLSSTLEWTASEHVTLGGTYVAYAPGERIRQVGGRSDSFATGLGDRHLLTPTEEFQEE